MDYDKTILTKNNKKILGVNLVKIYDYEIKILFETMKNN